MFFVTLIAILVACGVGYGIKWYLDKTQDDKRITWLEFGISAAAIAFIVAPLVIIAGVKLAIQERTTFHEYRNGWETAATVAEITCTRDGPCRWSYDCDPYTVCEECNCDSKGNCSTCCHTEYHDCPYCTSEYNYDVQTTLGPFRINSNRFPSYPNGHRWRAGHVVPSSVIVDAGAGAPPFWKEAKARIDSGTPGPATGLFSYDNYLIRANYSILRDYAGSIAAFKEKKLLPDFNESVHDYYWSDKLIFVNVGVIDPQRWDRQVEYLNAELGSRLQGDLHVVVVRGVQNPDAYIIALKSYWQNPDIYGKNIASKNTILVAIGTEDGQKVSWARAITGMPMGNEMLITRLRNDFKGMALMPDSVLGTTVAHLSHGHIDSVSVSGGLSEFLLMINPFTRVPMRGYSYLKKEIRPTTGGFVLITIVAIIFSIAAWTPAIAIGSEWNKRTRTW